MLNFKNVLQAKVYFTSLASEDPNAIKNLSCLDVDKDTVLDFRQLQSLLFCMNYLQGETYVYRKIDVPPFFPFHLISYDY